MATELSGYCLTRFWVDGSHASMRSWAPASATPKDVITRRWFSPTRCSWVPAKNAPATSAPTTTRAKIATASAIPRSSCKILRIRPPLSVLEVGGGWWRSNLHPPSLSFTTLHIAPLKAAIISQRHTKRDAVDDGTQRRLTAPAHSVLTAGAHGHIDTGDLRPHRGHGAGRVEVLKRQAVREQRPDQRLHRLSAGLESEIPGRVARCLIEPVLHAFEPADQSAHGNGPCHVGPGDEVAVEHDARTRLRRHRTDRRALLVPGGRGDPGRHVVVIEPRGLVAIQIDEQ